MVTNSEFKDCIIANVDGKIVAIEGVFECEDDKTKTKYYIYRNIISGQEDIAFNVNILHKISYYMIKDELDRFSVDQLNLDERYNIIARAIRVECIVLNDREQIKKILKP